MTKSHKDNPNERRAKVYRCDKSDYAFQLIYLDTYIPRSSYTVSAIIKCLDIQRVRDDQILEMFLCYGDI